MTKVLLTKTRQFSALSFIAGAAVLLFLAFADRSRSAGAASTSAGSPQDSGSAVQPAAPAREALAALQSSSQSEISAQVSCASGHYDFVKAAPGAVLVADDANAQPAERALQFVSAYGGVFGISDASALKPEKTQSDDLGFTHVRLNQFHNGLPVFGAQLSVHMNEQGITAANGKYVADLALNTTPALASDVAGETALASCAKARVMPRGSASPRPTLPSFLLASRRGGRS